MEDKFEKLQEQHTRSDFYQCRRMFLGDNDEPILEPPEMFKTRCQMRKIRENKSSGTNQINLGVTNFLNLMSKDDPKMDKSKTKSKDQVKKGEKKSKIAMTMFLSEYTSVNPNDWSIEHQAGVQIYVNKNSGEVTTICPWENNKALASLKEEESPSSLDLSQKTEGTGSLVYDSAGVNELFSMLDSMKVSSPSKKSAAGGGHHQTMQSNSPVKLSK